MAELKKNPTLKDLQLFVQAMCEENGWANNNHLEKFLLFTEEVGELAEAIRKHEKMYGKKGDSDDKFYLEEEFADVLNYLIDLANGFDIDLEEAIRKKNEINKNRTWN